MLHTAWRSGLGAPAGLAQRELPRSGPDSEDRFPCVLGAGQRQRFSPVPVSLVGGPGVGKTAFLRALARHLDHAAGGALGKGLHLEPAEPVWILEFNRRTAWNQTRPPLGPSQADITFTFATIRTHKWPDGCD